SGLVAVTLTAGNVAGQDNKTLLLTILPSSGSAAQPVFVSIPPTPQPVVAGQPVLLTAAASDPGGETLLYTWNFGDGTTGYGPSPTHVYTAPGIYVAQVTVSNGVNSAVETVNVAVNPAPPVGGVLQVAKVALTFNFKPPPKSNPQAVNKDSLALSGIISLQPSLNPWRKTVVVAIGNFQQTFMLNGSGQSVGKNSSFKLSGKMPNIIYTVTSVKFALALKNQPLFAQLAPLGFTKNTVPKPGVHIVMPVLISVDGIVCLADVTVTYTAKAGSSGTGKK
ncbi:MAG: PKD domain-containing protein, partial [Planctomycetota bacterium]